jgi:hypothetical protein
MEHDVIATTIAVGRDTLEDDLREDVAMLMYQDAVMLRSENG